MKYNNFDEFYKAVEVLVKHNKKFRCELIDGQIDVFVFPEERPTPCAADGGESPLEDSPFETGIRRGAVVIPPAAANT